jgi:hypothetical protein
MDCQIDLSAYRNQTLELLFTTTRGSKGNTAYDWAAWSNFHFDGHYASQALPFRLIYNAETTAAELWAIGFVAPLWRRAECSLVAGAAF